MTDGRPLTDEQIAKTAATMKRQGVPDAQIAATVAALKRTQAVPVRARVTSSGQPAFKTRKTGSVRQVGKKFPTGQSPSDILSETRVRDIESDDGENLVDPRPLSRGGERCDNCGHVFRQGEQGYITETGETICKICGRKAQLQNVPINELTKDREIGYSDIEHDACIGCGSTRRSLCEHGMCYSCRLERHCCRENE